LNNTNHSILIVAHQAILRVIYGVLMNINKNDIPHISIPLHRLIRLDVTELSISANIISML